MNAPEEVAEVVEGLTEFLHSAVDYVRESERIIGALRATKRLMDDLEYLEESPDVESAVAHLQGVIDHLDRVFQEATRKFALVVAGEEA